MNAIIIQFIPRPRQRKKLFEFPLPVGWSFRVNDLTMGRADVVETCKNVLSIGDCRERNGPGQWTSLGCAAARETSPADKSGAPTDSCE
jgi:hypothetical protein